MHRDVIDARMGAAAVVVEQIGGRGHATADIADEAAGAGPVAAQGAAITVVPFRPARRKTADLVAVVAEVPWLSDQLDGGEHRILAHGGEEAGVGIESAAAATERRREI